MKTALLVVFGLLVGCTHGLQEVSFAVPDAKDGVHHIVQRDIVSSRVTANQPHAAGQFHCTGKYTSVEMAELRVKYGEHTWFKDCTPTVDMPQHKYVLTSDQSVITALQGPLSAAIIGGSLVAMGLVWPEDNVTMNNQSGSYSKGGNASARSYSDASAKVNIRRHY